MDSKRRLWIFLILLKLHHCEMTTEGCVKQFNEDDCVYELQCRNTVDEMDLVYTQPYQYDQYGQIVTNTDEGHTCHPRQCNRGQCLPVYLTYRETKQVLHVLHEEIPRYLYRGHYGFDYNAFSPFILHLDLSENHYGHIPPIKQMENLVFLNLSRNVLTTAVLVGRSGLPSLEKIDFSFNTINTIIVHKDLYNKNLKNLNISNNYLVEIPDAIFDVFVKLETLDLSHNFIDTLNTYTFEGLKNMVSLFLSHNRIADVNFSLFRFKELTVLDLSHNRIESVKISDFEKLTKLEVLYLNNNAIMSIESSVFRNTPFLKTVNLRDNSLEIIGKDVFLNSSNLENVDLSNNHLRALPIALMKGDNLVRFSVNGNVLEGVIRKGLFEGLTRVITLDLSGQQFTAIEDYAFFGLEKVQTLDCSQNKLGSLSKNAFRELRYLSLIDLSYNNITEINIDTQDLLSIRIMLLRNNAITQIKQTNFEHLGTLHVLDLSNNKIVHFESNSFVTLSALIDFQISNNPIRGVLAENTFSGLESLPVLTISGTQITLFKNGSFTGMSRLQKLNVSHSKLTDLEYNSFTNTGDLESIDLSHNQLSTFNVNTTELQNLKILLLNNNLMKLISDRTFMGLSRLTSINLSYNNIKTIDKIAFSDQNDLEDLDISYNTDFHFNVSYLNGHTNLHNMLLSGIKGGIDFANITENNIWDLTITFSGLKNLTKVNLGQLIFLKNVVLKNNDVRKLESGAFSKLLILESVDISYNKITFIQPGVFKDNEKLKHLNISHNMLTTVSYGIFRGLIRLTVLDMSYNSINSLETERFYEVSSLNELIVDNNNIEYFNADEFAGTDLETLSIGGNPIPCSLLVNFLKTTARFYITAITIDERNYENINGVTCISNGYKYVPKENTSNINIDERILIDIKDILTKIENKNIIDRESPLNTNDESQSQLLTNLTKEMQKMEFIYDTKLTSLINTSSAIIKESSGTNVLLYKIFELLNRESVSTTLKPILKENVTQVQDLLQYINNLKKELENTVAMAKKSILDEVDRKIAVTTAANEPAIKPEKEKLSADKEIKEGKSLFTETCVGLILLILVCFVLYKFYKSKMFVRTRRSYSTRELPDAMESQDL